MKKRDFQINEVVAVRVRAKDVADTIHPFADGERVRIVEKDDSGFKVSNGVARPWWLADCELKPIYG